QRRVLQIAFERAAHSIGREDGPLQDERLSVREPYAAQNNDLSHPEPPLLDLRGAPAGPLPETQQRSPSWTRRWTAARAVIRETPNSSHSCASEGRGEWGSSRSARSRSACSIS